MSKNLRSLWLIGLGCGILFTAVAVGQYAFLRYQIDKETTLDLLSGADEMREDFFRLSPGIFKVIVILPRGQTRTS